MIDDVYRMNLRHVFLVPRTMLPLLRNAGPGASVTTVSSIEGFRGILGFGVRGIQSVRWSVITVRSCAVARDQAPSCSGPSDG